MRPLLGVFTEGRSGEEHASWKTKSNSKGKGKFQGQPELCRKYMESHMENEMETLGRYWYYAGINSLTLRMTTPDIILHHMTLLFQSGECLLLGRRGAGGAVVRGRGSGPFCV